MKTLFSIILSISSVLSMAQGIAYDVNLISNQTRKLVEGIAMENSIHGSGVGIAGVRTPQYERFEELKKKASSEELRVLTAHPNAAVRGYAFWALTIRKDAQAFNIMKTSLQDSTEVSTFFGCIMDKELLIDFYISLMDPSEVEKAKGSPDGKKKH